MGIARKWSDEDLETAIIGSISWAQVLGKLELKLAGGNYVSVQNKARTLGFDTSHILGQRAALGKPGPRKIPIEDILVKDSSYGTYGLRRRLIKEGFKTHKCEKCGLTEWLGEPIPLETDHINGDRMDHRIENLQLLCCNCHAFTPTWRGRNKGNGSVADVDLAIG